MTKKGFIVLAIGIVFLAAEHTNTAFAGPPLNNLEGVGGIALNPLAYTAGTPLDAGSGGLADVVSKPQIGIWYVSLSDVDVDWTAIGAADTLFKRFEVAAGYAAIAPNGQNIHTYDLAGKLLLINENQGGSNFIPAVSIGAVHKQTSGAADGVDDADTDYYLVATKLIPQLPKPVLLSGGVLSTKGLATGVFGFDEDRKTTFFGNIDVLPIPQLAVGVEYKHGARFDDFKNADYYNVHAAWFVNKSLSLVAAYVDAGDEKSTNRVGLGDGVVFSVQYAF